MRVGRNTTAARDPHHRSKQLSGADRLPFSRRTLVILQLEPKIFLGHFAVGFGSKRFAPRTSLVWLLIAPLLADILWPLFLALGWEHVRIDPTATRFSPLDLYDFHRVAQSGGAGRLGHMLRASLAGFHPPSPRSHRPLDRCCESLAARLDHAPPRHALVSGQPARWPRLLEFHHRHFRCGACNVCLRSLDACPSHKSERPRRPLRLCRLYPSAHCDLRCRSFQRSSRQCQRPDLVRRNRCPAATGLGMVVRQPSHPLQRLERETRSESCNGVRGACYSLFTGCPNQFPCQRTPKQPLRPALSRVIFLASWAPARPRRSSSAPSLAAASFLCPAR